MFDIISEWAGKINDGHERSSLRGDRPQESPIWFNVDDNRHWEDI